MKQTGSNSKVHTLILIALFAALTAVGCYIRIPLPPPLLPVTLQTFFVLLAGFLLGKKAGAVSMLVYMALGLLGLPIFTGGGGLSYVAMPSFGFVIGFVCYAFVIGLLSERYLTAKSAYWKYLAVSLCGFLVFYAIGLFYMYLILNFYVGTPTGVGTVLMTGFVVFLPGDLLKLAVGAFLAKKLRRLLPPILGK